MLFGPLGAAPNILSTGTSVNSALSHSRLGTSSQAQQGTYRNLLQPLERKNFVTSFPMCRFVTFVSKNPIFLKKKKKKKKKKEKRILCSVLENPGDYTGALTR
jgi:hypothetical protein